MAKGAKAAWDTLKEQHQNEGPVWQVDLLHTALNIKFPAFYKTYTHQQRKKNIPQRTFVTT